MGVSTGGKLKVIIPYIKRVCESLSESERELLNLQKEYENIIENINNAWKDQAGNRFVSEAMSFSQKDLTILCRNIGHIRNNIKKAAGQYESIK